jgi:hypothetical protein
VSTRVGWHPSVLAVVVTQLVLESIPAKEHGETPDLAAVVEKALEPAHMSVWIRAGERQ